MPIEQWLRNPRHSTRLADIPSHSPKINIVSSIPHVRPDTPVRSVAAITSSAHLFELIALPQRIVPVVALGFEVFVAIAVDIGPVVHEAVELGPFVHYGSVFARPVQFAAVEFVFGVDNVAVAVVVVEGH